MTSSNGNPPQNNSFKPAWIGFSAVIIAALITVAASIYNNERKIAYDNGTAIQNLTDKCNQSITTNNSKEIIDSCERLIDKNVANDTMANAYINHARASVFRWEEGKLPESELVAVQKDFNQAVKLTHDDPKALFYQAYWEDFQQRAIKPNPNKLCLSAIDRYEKVIDAYLAKYQNVLEEYREKGRQESVASIQDLSEEEAYILIELGHWVNNRDRDWDLAIDFYDIVLAHYAGSNNLVEYNTLVSRGIAWYNDSSFTPAIQDYKSAVEFLENTNVNQKAKITKYPEIYSNYASALAIDRRYSEAVDAYNKAIENQSDSSKKYYNLRSIGFALILEGKLEYASQELNSKAQEKFKEAIEVLITAENTDSKAQDDGSLHLALGIANYHQGNEDEAEKYLKIAQQTLNSDYAIANLAVNEYQKLLSGEKKTLDYDELLSRKEYFVNPIPHDLGHDPFLKVKHDKMYCDAKDPRI